MWEDGRAMELNENAELGSGQVEDRRGSTGRGGGGFGGGGGGFPIPIGGKLGLIITVIIVLGGLFFGGAKMFGGGGGNQQADNANLEQKCAKSNPNRFQEEDCRNWLYVTSI